MFGNYLKVTLQNILNQRLFSVINLFGLAFGLACCLLIIQFVRHEFTWDDHWEGAENIYRLSPDYSAEALGGERHSAANVAALVPLIERTGLEGVESIARIGGMHALVSRQDQASYEDNVRWADGAIFDIFNVDWLQGSPEGALDSPHSAVLTASIARKYFGDTSPLGETVLLENSVRVTITGVIADLPANSHLSADIITSMDTAWDVLGFDYSNNWSFTFFHTYVRLAPGMDAGVLADRLPGLIEANVDSDLQESFRLGDDRLTFTAYNVRDIHLQSQRRGEFREPGSLAFVLTFSVIALTILLVACINFMNLSTARASKRAREVGLRKAIGASHSQLVIQFLGESFLLSVLSVVIALMLVELLLPAFNALVNRELDFLLFSDPLLLGSVIAVTLLTALVAGSYPALYLAAFNPTRVLKQASPRIEKGLALRNLLVIIQFTVAIVLIIVTVVVTLQMRFVHQAELGYNKDQVLVLWGTHEQGMGAGWPALKQALLQRQDIANVTEDVMYPGRAGGRLMRIEGGDPAGFNIRAKQIGANFLDTYGIDLVAGRGFNEDIVTDTFIPPANITDGSQATATWVLNESAVRQLGFTPEEILGRAMDMDFGNDFSTTVTGPVIGVVEDVHWQSLRQEIQPLVYYAPPLNWGDGATFVDASVRLNSNDVARTLDDVGSLWEAYIPEIPFIYNFLDTDFEALYLEEEQQGQLVSWSAGLAIIIACLGLFGLAAFSAERRKKEIGVRKVMGGSVWSIVVLLTNDFSKLVLISNLIAWPVAYVAMNRWLSNFAYRIDLTPVIFIGSGLIALCIAWVTVGGTAAKAASQRPVLALRYE